MFHDTEAEDVVKFRRAISMRRRQSYFSTSDSESGLLVILFVIKKLSEDHDAPSVWIDVHPFADVLPVFLHFK